VVSWMLIHKTALGLLQYIRVLVVLLCWTPEANYFSSSNHNTYQVVNYFPFSATNCFITSAQWCLHPVIHVHITDTSLYNI
jgi:hypothetical protein